MTKTGMLINSAVFIETFQSTALGSCNSLSTSTLWTFISTYSYDKQVKMITGYLQLAEYVVERLKEMTNWLTKKSNGYDRRTKTPKTSRNVSPILTDIIESSKPHWTYQISTLCPTREGF